MATQGTAGHNGKLYERQTATIARLKAAIDDNLAAAQRAEERLLELIGASDEEREDAAEAAAEDRRDDYNADLMPGVLAEYVLDFRALEEEDADEVR